MKRKNFFVRLCYGYVKGTMHKDVSKMSAKEVIQAFLDRFGVSSPSQFFKEKFKKKPKNAFEFVENKAHKVTINGKFIQEAKDYSLRSVWINKSKYGRGYYFSLDIDGQRHFIPIDYKTANGKSWLSLDEIIHRGSKPMKISSDGFIYLGEDGKPRYAIKNKTTWEQVWD
jgi:hypothetical protein